MVKPTCTVAHDETFNNYIIVIMIYINTLVLSYIRVYDQHVAPCAVKS